MFYLDQDNVVHDLHYSASTGNWAKGTLSEQRSVALSNSSLTALYDWCSTCGNTIIVAFQADDGSSRIGNLTADGWIVGSPGLALQPPLPGTGLALYAFFSSGRRDQMNLFYQRQNLGLAFAYYVPPKKNKTG